MERQKSLSKVGPSPGWHVWCEYVWLSLLGFDELGGTDDFSTELLEWRLGCAAVIHYTGNLLEPPAQGPDKRQVTFHSKKTIRDTALDSSDSD